MIKSHEAHASLLSATLAAARLLILNPLARFAMMGICAVFGLPFTALAASIPEMSGRLTSIKIKSGSSETALATASFPFAASIAS